MRRARMWAWKRVARAATWVVRFASIRAAKACGCEGCQVLYDEKAQARAIDEAVSRMFGEGFKRPERDRRPS